MALVQKRIEDSIQVAACSSQKGDISVLRSGILPIQCGNIALFCDGEQKFWRQTLELCHMEAVKDQSGLVEACREAAEYRLSL